MQLLRGLTIALALVLLSAAPAAAELGVGVNVAKIAVNNKLVPGVRYTLPSIGVVNTGDTTSTTYAVRIQYVREQRELRPDAGWFSFEPARFELDPKQARKVTTTLALPPDARPGKYFALLAGYPDVSARGLPVGAAAATKLTFEVVDDRSFLEKAKDWLAARWSYLGVAAALLALVAGALSLRPRRSQKA